MSETNDELLAKMEEIIRQCEVLLEDDLPPTAHLISVNDQVDELGELFHDFVKSTNPRTLTAGDKFRICVIQAGADRLREMLPRAPCEPQAAATALPTLHHLGEPAPRSPSWVSVVPTQWPLFHCKGTTARLTCSVYKYVV